jgi:hypothetical protein
MYECPLFVRRGHSLMLLFELHYYKYFKAVNTRYLQPKNKIETELEH